MTEIRNHYLLVIGSDCLVSDLNSSLEIDVNVIGVMYRNRNCTIWTKNFVIVLS